VPSQTTSNHWFGYAAVILGATGFSAKAIIIKLAYRYGVDAITLLMLRMLFAAPLFVLAMIWAQRFGGENAAIHRRDWLSLAAMGFIGYYLASLFDFIGLQYITAALERLVLFTYPSIVLLIGVVIFGQRIMKSEWGALILTYIGIAAVVAHDLSVDLHDQKVLIGSAWVFASSVSYAIYIVAVGKVGKHLGSLRLAAIASLFSSAFVIIHGAATGVLPKVLQQPWQVYAYGALMAVIATVLPVLLTVVGIRRVGASKAALLSSIGPVITIFFGWLFLSEVVSVVQLLGAGLVIAGVLLMTRPKSAGPADQAPRKP
jgi:drug/metabolite transporter (DMT)-like permease